MEYIQNGQSYTINQAIPNSSSGSTVTCQVRRNSDGYYYNFTSSAFQSSSASGTMSYDYGEWWNIAFTPATDNDTHNVTITFGSIYYYQELRSVGVAQTLTDSGDNFTSTANVKQFLDNKSDSDDDALIADLITEVSAWIKTYCGRDILDATYTEYYDGNGTNTLLVDQYPINSITSIYDDTDYSWGSGTQISNDDVIYSSKTENEKLADQGIIKLTNNTFTEGEGNIKITYNAGETSVPADLELACIKLVAADWRELKQGIDIAVEGQTDLPARWRSEAKKIIDIYKRIR